MAHFSKMPAPKPKPAAIIAAPSPLSAAPAKVAIAPMRRIPTRQPADPAPAFAITFRGVSYCTAAGLHDGFVRFMFADRDPKFGPDLLAHEDAWEIIDFFLRRYLGYSRVEMAAALVRAGIFAASDGCDK